MNLIRRTPMNAAGPPRSAWRRCGVSLIEVTAVIGANAALTAAAISALVAIRRVDRDLSTRLVERQVVAQLAGQLRRDVRAATSLRWNDADQELAITGAGESMLRYIACDGGWQRRQLADGQPKETGEAGALAGAFQTPGGVGMAVSPADATAGDVVHITLRVFSEDPEGLAAPPRARELIVTVGRDTRLLNP
jgi:hypothetical protein